jgi:hypothetical protein
MNKTTRIIVVCISVVLIVLFLIDIEYQNLFSKSNRTEIIGIIVMIICIITMVVPKKGDTKMKIDS